MSLSLEAIYYCDQVPEFEIRDTMVHITYLVGRMRFHVVLPIAVALKARIMSGEIVAKWQYGRLTSDNIHAIK